MLKKELIEFVRANCGDAEIGIAPADDLSKEVIDMHINTNRIMGNYTPIITEETPVAQPREFYEDAKAIIVLGINLFFGRPELPGNPPRSEFMNFYVNQECVDYISEQNQKIISFLEEKGYVAMLAAYGTPIKAIRTEKGVSIAPLILALVA